jgi:hypothetical protein
MVLYKYVKDGVHISFCLDSELTENQVKVFLGVILWKKPVNKDEGK